MYRDTGCMAIYAGTSVETAGKVVESIVKEFRELKENLVPAEELRRAKDHLKGSFMLGLESTSSRMGNLARQELYFKRFFTLDEMLESIEAVTAEQVRRHRPGILRSEEHHPRRARQPGRFPHQTRGPGLLRVNIGARLARAALRSLRAGRVALRARSRNRSSRKATSAISRNVLDASIARATGSLLRPASNKPPACRWRS